MIKFITLSDRVWLAGKFRNVIGVDNSTTYLIPREYGVEFDFDETTHLIPWGAISLVTYA